MKDYFISYALVSNISNGVDLGFGNVHIEQSEPMTPSMLQSAIERIRKASGNGYDGYEIVILSWQEFER